MAVAVVDKNGVPLMPTSNYKARKLLKKGRATIFKYRPVFTIMIVDREGGETQPVEYKCKTGYDSVTVSVCTQKKEVLSMVCDLLPDETKKHDDRRRYRRTRRGRLRHRKPRFLNRKGMICRDGFAPSIRNKRDVHVRLFVQITGVIPVTVAIFEMGPYDPRVLRAVEAGEPVPGIEDPQFAEDYGYSTQRKAVFSRDGYKCICCGKGPKSGAILRMHHLGYKDGDRTNRLSNLATVCTGCHTHKNHEPGGKLYELEPKAASTVKETFMMTVRRNLVGLLSEARPDIEIRITYSAMTQLKRKAIGLPKSPANDAYAMGILHPKQRAETVHLKKKRRNNRILEKFYDARYTDVRDGKTKSGGQLSCGRTNRSESRHTEKDERPFRGHGVSKGKRSIRTERHPIQAGDIVLYKGKTYCCRGTMSGGKSILLQTAKDSPTGKAVTASPEKVRILRRCAGWIKVEAALYPHS